VRGREKSVSPAQVINEINDKVLHGYKEVVLTGTEIGSYSYDGLNLNGLIDIILKDTTVERLRLSSLQPQEVTPALISLWKDARLCPHFHLSLQSGSDTVLKRMKRHYTTDDYLMRFHQPFGAGGLLLPRYYRRFPGESDEEFLKALSLRRMGFLPHHVFLIQRGAGTAATTCRPNIPQVKKKRSDSMLNLQKISIAFHSNYIGKILRVLWEQAENGIWNGYSANYIKVYAAGDRDLTNLVSDVLVERLYEGGVWGEIKSLILY
jgi:threonylcarbamoyladenosine tRNA methylthiotransferase MtaB